MSPSPTARTALLPASTSSATYGAVPAQLLAGAADVPSKLTDVEQCPPPPPEAPSDDPSEHKPPGSPPNGAVEEVKNRPFREIALLCLGGWTAVFCAALSASVTANLASDIASSFKAGHLASWLAAAYLLGNAALTPLWGRLSAIIGRRQAMLSSMFIFIISTAGCALAPTMMTMLAFRFFAGCGGGGMLTVTAIIVSDLVSTRERGVYQGYVNTLFGAGSATGAVIGGWVGDHFGWRWAFGMQLVPLAFSLVLIIWKVHVPHPPQKLTPLQLLLKIDWWGFLLLLTSVTALMLSLSLHTASGYALSHPLVWGLFALFAASTVGFWAVEEYWAAEPLIPMSLLKERTPAFVLCAFLLLTLSTFARLFMVPLYLHTVRDFNGTKTGLILLPSTITGSAGSLYAGFHMRRFGKYKTLSIMASILPLLSAVSVLATWGADVSVWRMSVECAVASWGGGIAITSFLTALIAACPPEIMPVAVSSSYLFRSIGQVLGVALTGSVQQWALAKDLDARLSAVVGSTVIKRIILEPSTVLPELAPSVYREAIAAYLYSINAVFAFAFVIGAAMVACAVGMKAYPLSGR